MYIEESLHPWNKPDLIMVYELLDMLLNFVEEFCILCLSVILPCSFLFCVLSLSGFGIRVMWPRGMSLKVFLPLTVL